MKKILNSRVATVILFILCFFIIIGLAEVFIKRYKVQKEISELKTRAETLKNKNEKLVKAISKLQNPDYIKNLAKKRFNLVEKGEKAAVIINEEESEAESEASQKQKYWLRSTVLQKIPYIKEKPKVQQNIVKWWNLFFGSKQTV